MDVMIDMETMSNRNNAAIASIGAVAFNPDVITSIEQLDPRHVFNVHVDLTQQEGRHFDGDTIYWWLQQSQEARTALRPRFNMPPDSPRVAVQKFTDWYKTVNGGRTWSFGATFDLVLLTDLYRWCHLKNPIHYRDQACARTIIHIASLPRPEVAGMVSHGALDDAVIQALWLQQSMQKIRGNWPQF